MVQRIKVQSGRVVYEASDSAYDLSMDVSGQVNVSKELNVGNDPLADGSISTPDNTDLNIEPGLNGNLNLTPSGSGVIVLAGVSWPAVLSPPVPGKYMGFSSLGALSYLDTILSPMAPDDFQTPAQLDILFPSAVAGQQALGPNTLYQKVGAGNWKRISALSYTPVNLAGDIMTGPLILSGDPVNTLGAATKQYVDNLVFGLSVHASCETATTATLASSTGGTITYNNGVSGVGATLTTTTSWGTVGGFATTNGDRILVKNEANQIHNGIYVRTSATVLTRATDFDDSPDGEIQAGDFTYIQSGTLGGTQWVQTTVDPIVGTNNIVFTQLSGVGTYTGGTGINVTGTTISNTGVLSAIGSTNISVSAATGNVTFSLVGTVPSAFDLAGGVANQIPFQNAPGDTVFNAGLTFNPSTGILTAIQFSGSGATLTNIPNAALVNSSVTVNGTSISLGGSGVVTAAAGTLTGTTLNATVVNSSLTSVGTLTSLSVSGNATVSGNLIRGVQTGISAAGATLGTATDLVEDFNVVSTVAAGTGVSLMPTVGGMSVIVVNTGANDLNVYPASGSAQIDSLGLGVAFSLPVGARIMFFSVSATQWYTLNATYS